MQMQESTIPRPPGLVATLAKGFDTIANNIAIIILPVMLDLFLWLGPKLRLKTLLAPLLDQMTASALPMAESLPDPASMQQLWDEFLNPDVFSRVGEAKVLVEARTLEYNGTRPHSFPGIPATGF